jgi:hypothetical protein
MRDRILSMIITRNLRRHHVALIHDSHDTAYGRD